MPAPIAHPTLLESIRLSDGTCPLLPYHQQRFTLAYANRLPESEGLSAEHLVVLQLQIVF